MDKFKEQIEDFILYLKVQKRASAYTIKTYELLLEQVLKIIQKQNIQSPEKDSFASLQGPDLRAIVREMNFFVDNDKRVKNSTLANHIYVLSSLYKYLIKMKICKENPCIDIKAPKVQRPIPRVLDEKEVDKFLDIETSDPLAIRNKAMLELLFSSGLRVGELVGLNISDIDFENEEIRVLGKGNKQRVVPFGSCAKKALGEYLKLRDYFNPQDDEVLFLGKLGTRLTTRSVQLIVKKIAQENLMDGNVTPHKLRHSFATQMLSGGADLRMVQELLGHSSLAATQIYTHIDYKHLKEIYNKAHPKAIEEDGKKDQD